jgi:sugar-specific transcriptional regulator TrmB
MEGTAENQKILLIKNLIEFGLTEIEASVYIELTRIGTSTSYKLHQVVGIGRSVLDKVLEDLISKNMVSLQQTNQSKVYTAHPYKNLSNLVEVKEAEVGVMKNSLNKIYERFAGLDASILEGNSQVLHYYGIEGLKQVVWNTLRAREEMRIFEVSRLSAFMQKQFAEKYREECAFRGIHHFDMTNESFIPGWTDVKAYLKNNECRFIDPSVLEIKFEIYIYNDVVTLIDYKDNELLCLEIYNPFLATLQKQLFDYIWKDAKKMEITGARGELSIVKT